MKRRSLFRARILFVALSTIALPVACSGHAPLPNGSNSGPPAKTPYSSYAIHVMVGSGSRAFALNIPPVPEPKAAPLVVGTAVPSAHSATNETPPLGTQAVIEVPDGGKVDLGDWDKLMTQTPNWEPGYFLLFGAAAECAGKVRTDSGISGGVTSPAIGIIVPPWQGVIPVGDPGWYVFDAENRKFPTCDDILAREQINLCIADKLAEVADAVSPVVWTGPEDYASMGLGAFAQPWTIPPQSKKDRFIVRDLEINALAHLARLDMESPGSTDIICGAEFSSALATSENNQALDQGTYDTLFTTTPDILPMIPSPSQTVAETTAIALRARIQLQAHVLREGGRLLRDAIEKSVYADLAGAEQQSALAADPARGAALRWGVRDGDATPYNSLAHAYRVLFGRWEMGDPITPDPGWNDAPIPSGDPRCGGLAEMDLLTQGLDGGTSARWNDRALTTNEQETATRMVDRAGIVLPPESLGDMTAVRGAVRAQLHAIASRELGVAASDPKFAGTELEQSIDTTLDNIKDADLKFGLEQSLTAYRLVTQRSDQSLTLIGPPSGSTDTRGESGLLFQAKTDTVSDVVTLGGAIVPGGVPRLDAAVDFSKRVHRSFPVVSRRFLWRKWLAGCGFARPRSRREMLGIHVDSRARRA